MADSLLHLYTHPEPSSHLLPHTIPLGHPSAPAPSIQYRASNLDLLLPLQEASPTLSTLEFTTLEHYVHSRGFHRGIFLTLQHKAQSFGRQVNAAQRTEGTAATATVLQGNSDHGLALQKYTNGSLLTRVHMQGPYKAAPAHPADLSVHEFALALSASLPQNFSLPSRQENAPDFFAGGIQ